MTRNLTCVIAEFEEFCAFSANLSLKPAITPCTTDSKCANCAESKDEALNTSSALMICFLRNLPIVSDWNRLLLTNLRLSALVSAW